MDYKSYSRSDLDPRKKEDKDKSSVWGSALVRVLEKVLIWLHVKIEMSGTTRKIM